MSNRLSSRAGSSVQTSATKLSARPPAEGSSLRLGPRHTRIDDPRAEGGEQPSQSTKIALIINDDFSMHHFRGELIRSLVARGYDVSVIVPSGEYGEKLAGLGARCHCVEMYRFSSPLKDLRLLFDFYRLFRRERFDLVHNMTIKPNIYGTIAARAAGIRNVVCLVSGLGLVFSDVRGLRVRALRFVSSWLYWGALKLARRTWFQNPDDRDRFVDLGLIAPEKAVVIRSGGINLEEFSANSVSDVSLQELRDEIGVPGEARCVVMVTARLVWSKGVREFFEAARLLEARLPGWTFVMLCPRDEASWESVPEEYVANHRPGNLVLIDSFRKDVKRFVALADVVALPSFYPEGVPRTLLEALAMSKPIVTTDHPGCREAVDDGENGFLVPTRDQGALADRIEELADSETLRGKFGTASRQKCENEFSSEIVVNRIIKEIYSL